MVSVGIDHQGIRGGFICDKSSFFNQWGKADLFSKWWDKALSMENHTDNQNIGKYVLLQQAEEN